MGLNMSRSCLSIILAAGEGTRMKSSIPKVLHKVAGLSLIGHVIRQIKSLGVGEIAAIVGRGAEEVTKEAMAIEPNVHTFVQTERLGTAHAVLAARDILAKQFDDVLIVFGDTPLIETESLKQARKELADGADIVVMGFKTDNPAGYGRLIEKDGKLTAIVEDKDATAEQKKITFCNGGLMAINGKRALELLSKVENNNAKKEYYLTDIVSIGSNNGLHVRAIEVPFENVIGINTRVELANAEAIWQKRKAKEVMLAGVTMLRPESVYFSYDTEIGQDVIIEPNVYFGKGVKVGDSVVIHAFSHLEGAEVAEHTEIGTHSNIGAGTITCNYDGFNKWQTIIGDDAFIGSNTALVAPVKVGNRAYVASGSVITADVPDDSVGFGRAHQKNKENYATVLRERFSKLKQK